MHCSADDDDSVAAADDIVARISSRMISFHGDYVLNLDERFDEAGAVPGILVQVNAVDARQWTE